MGGDPLVSAAIGGESARVQPGYEQPIRVNESVAASERQRHG